MPPRRQSLIAKLSEQSNASLRRQSILSNSESRRKSVAHKVTIQETSNESLSSSAHSSLTSVTASNDTIHESEESSEESSSAEESEEESEESEADVAGSKLSVNDYSASQDSIMAAIEQQVSLESSLASLGLDSVMGSSNSLNERKTRSGNSSQRERPLSVRSEDAAKEFIVEAGVDVTRKQRRGRGERKSFSKAEGGMQSKRLAHYMRTLFTNKTQTLKELRSRAHTLETEREELRTKHHLQSSAYNERIATELKEIEQLDHEIQLARKKFTHQRVHLTLQLQKLESELSSKLTTIVEEHDQAENLYEDSSKTLREIYHFRDNPEMYKKIVDELQEQLDTIDQRQNDELDNVDEKHRQEEIEIMTAHEEDLTKLAEHSNKKFIDYINARIMTLHNRNTNLTRECVYHEDRQKYLTQSMDQLQHELERDRRLLRGPLSRDIRRHVLNKEREKLSKCLPEMELQLDLTPWHEDPLPAIVKSPLQESSFWDCVTQAK